MDKTTTATQRLMKFGALEGLLKGLGVAEGSEDYRLILEVADYKPGREMPVERYYDALLWIAARFFPGVPQSEALYRAGSVLFDGYRTTIVGRIQLAALKVLGPQDLAMRIPRFFGTNTNFGDRSVRKVGATHYEVYFLSVPLPASYYAGIFMAGMRVTGVQDPTVEWEQLAEEDMRFTLRWR